MDAPAAPGSHARADGRLAAAQRTRTRKRWLLAGVLAALVAGAAATVRPPPPAPPAYVTAPITRGRLVATMETTGTVNPLLQVTVGAQVSGRVSKVNVDFNATVKKGDVLAELEPAPFLAQLNQAKAALASGEAQVRRAEVDLRNQQRALERAQALRDKGMNAGADLDNALAARDAAEAQVDVARAQVEQARASVAASRENLACTRILAPVDGTVVSRAVDPGQTVAANFQAPTLFVIANNLVNMRVVASVDEADVGRVREGAPAEVRVDAFPAEVFRGVVRELRVQPTTTQGVVTYPAVVDVPNPDRKLRPGMTATVTVVTAEKDGVLTVPSAALRFQPGGTATGRRAKASVLHVLREGGAVPVPVETGIADETHTEVSGAGVQEGDTVIVDERGPVSGPSPGNSRPPGPPRLF